VGQLWASDLTTSITSLREDDFWHEVLYKEPTYNNAIAAEGFDPVSQGVHLSAVPQMTDGSGTRKRVPTWENVLEHGGAARH
jgi:hypothetical protein